MLIGIAWCVLGTAVLCSAEKWRFPEEAAAASSVRIDSKVKFTDREDNYNNRNSRVQSDEIPFKQPTETEGFYNRPPGVGKYPVRTENHRRHEAYQVSEKPDFSEGGYDSDGTLDSLQYCKCVTTPECNPRPESQKACGSGRFLCCYKRPNQANHQNSEFFNEVEDERPMLFPSRENVARPFPPPPGTELNAGFGPGHAHEVGILGALDRTDTFVGQNGAIQNNGNRRVLVGPDGPTGVIGPAQQNSGVLVGPSGPTGIIGPTNNRRDVGQNVNYPNQFAQRGILVGPGGPTGIIGPAFGRRPILVGPGGPTGVIGPNRPGNRGILVGPGGPTGIIGPGLNRHPRPEYLARPEGPTIGLDPNRQILVGPGGPTGQIGPQYFGCPFKKTKVENTSFKVSGSKDESNRNACVC